ncbi:MAG: hypothetical protein HKN21_16450 [Candidatus Eisenbacteria bacterium]|uniref:Fibronectin type III domain-containing protein n=1 Tax=Eiseniibacteriota bacterium TaxID=2212470 RepID=A0A7Y2EH43_UNCEI|nr:hypothetical protein [Candidatus Eisenbacteria bacterium]
MKLRIAFLLVMMLTPALLLVGCSSDSNSGINNPDTTPPLAPVVLGAKANGGSVGVWWRAGSEADLQGYYVYASRNGQVTRVTSVPLAANYFAFSSNEGVVSTYITAVDWNGNESSPSASRSVRISPDEIDGFNGSAKELQDGR